MDYVFSQMEYFQGIKNDSHLFDESRILSNAILYRYIRSHARGMRETSFDYTIRIDT
jgi:hypothetical protein